uniref:Putative LOC101850970 [Aplysia californica] n=1 Tax=Lepeophtheirus salmonis TaxID=72036 RepID=A0A0K2TLQ2_LEPSM
MQKNPGTSLDELLFTYRSTPLSRGNSTAQLLFSMPMRNHLNV